MKVALIARSTLYTVPGGDTIQIKETAKNLNKLGIETEICLTTNKIKYNNYDLLHFFNITRPADILYHINKTNKLFVISPNFIDYSEFDKHYRHGIAGWIMNKLPGNANEYLKTVSRWLLGKDALRSKEYLWRGQKGGIRKILKKASWLYPTSEMECVALRKKYRFECGYSVIPNGIDPVIFHANNDILKDDKLVLCAARIEGLKNQVNLIKALNNTSFTLMIIGEVGPNHSRYYEVCKSIASKNILFTGKLSQKELASFYAKAKVHVLPSWFETCGLSSLEAAAMGCNIVITDKGYTREYFGDEAFYCDPADPGSIYQSIKEAAGTDCQKILHKRIKTTYTWENAAGKILEGYNKIL